MLLTGIVVVVLRLFNVASTLPAVVTVKVKKLVPCWTRVPPKNSEPAGVSTAGGVGAGWVVLVSLQPTARHNTTRTAKKRATLIRRGSILVGRTQKEKSGRGSGKYCLVLFGFTARESGRTASGQWSGYCHPLLMLRRDDYVNS